MSAPKTAAENYVSNRARIDAALERLKALLAAHHAEQQATPMNWGHGGDLGHVAAQLEAINSFLAGEG